MSAKLAILSVSLLLASCPFLNAQDDQDLAHFQRFFLDVHTHSLEHDLAQGHLVLEQAREIKDAGQEAGALRNLALIHLTRSHDYERALDLLIQSLAIADSLDLESQQTLTYVAIARVFEKVGDFHKSAGFLEQALEFDKEGRSINSVALILNNLGEVNASRGELSQALANYQQVLRYKNDIDKRLQAEALFNLGHLYTLQGEYGQALQAHKDALALTRQLGDKVTEALSLTDIGILYEKMKNYPKSLANHMVALEIRQDIQDKRGMAVSYNNIGFLYLKENKEQDAISNGILALEHSRESQAQEQIYRSYDLLSQSYKNVGDFKNALTYKELSLAMHEFIISEKQERQLLETQNRYIVGKKEIEIANLNAVRMDREREIAAQKKFQNILFLVVALVVVTAGLLLILYLVKRRSNRALEVAKRRVQAQNEQLLELNETKDKFFSIISHDLKGPLNSLTSFSRLLIDHTDSLSKEEIQMLAKDLDKSVRNLLTLLENLLDWSRSQTGSIEFTPEEFDITEVLRTNKELLSGQAAGKQIALELEYEGQCVVRLHKQSIHTVIRNLMSNAIKFTRQGGVVRAGIKQDSSRLLIFVADNGVGMTAEALEKVFRLGNKQSTQGTANEKGTGLGLILCKDFVEKNGGALLVESTPGKGSVFTSAFPLSVVHNAHKFAESASF